jgi:predicted DsbA family dithiol-disulfide isomerase
MASDEQTETCSPGNGCRLPSDSAATLAQPTPEYGTSATLKLDIVSDTICPWCYVGKRKLAAALEILGREGLTFDETWRPFQLNPDMPKQGLDRRQYRSAKFGSWERSQALDAQVAAVGQTVGLVFRHDLMAKTPNTLASHALIRLARETGGAAMQDRVVEALFAAYFTKGRDVGDHEILADLGAGTGLDHGLVLATLSDPAVTEAVGQEENLARGLGLNGVPSVLINGHYLFSGAQPIPVIVEALREAAAALSAPDTLVVAEPAHVDA